MRIVRHCLNLLAHTWTLKNSTSENQTKTKKEKKSETPRPVGKKIRDSEAQKKNTRKRDFETLKKRFRDFEIGPKFSETQVFRGTIRHPYCYFSTKCLGDIPLEPSSAAFEVAST